MKQKRNNIVKVVGRPGIGPDFALHKPTKEALAARRKYQLDWSAKEEYLKRVLTGEQYA